MLKKLFSHARGGEVPAVAKRCEAILLAEPALAEAIGIHRRVQALQRDAGTTAALQVSGDAGAANRLLAGVPLLLGTTGWIDVPAALKLFRALARGAVRGEAAQEAAAVVAIVDSGTLDLVRTVAATAALDTQARSALLGEAGEHAGVAHTLLDFALQPAFQAAAAAYDGVVNDAVWSGNICPICGSPPLLGELRGSESRRVLRCGRCGGSWDFQRLRCVSCATSDHKLLLSLHVDEQGDYLHVELCDACGCYIKSLARLDPIPVELLPAEDLATSHLDLAALARGYRRCGAPA